MKGGRGIYKLVLLIQQNHSSVAGNKTSRVAVGKSKLCWTGRNQQLDRLPLKAWRIKLVIAHEIKQCTVERHNVAISESLSDYHLGKVPRGNESVFMPVHSWKKKIMNPFEDCTLPNDVILILKVTFLNNIYCW